MVTLAETRLQKNRKAVFVTAQMPQQVPLADCRSRRSCAARAASRTARPTAPGSGSSSISARTTRSSTSSTARTSRATARKASSRRTPPSASRTRRCCCPRRPRGKIDDFATAARAAATAFVDNYKTYFDAPERPRRRQPETCSIRSPASCWCRGSACSGSAARRRTRRSAPISPRPSSNASPMPKAIGRFKSISEDDMFDVEYWSLEQAKLGAGQAACRSRARSPSSPAPAARSAARRRKAFAAAGAEVALLDIDEQTATAEGQTDRRLGARASVRRDGFGGSCARPSTRLSEHFGGVDIVVSNAGAAWQGRIGEVDEAMLAQELRAEFLRPSARRAGRREDHADARHRRLPPVQRVEAGGESGAEFRPLRPAEGRDAVPGAPIRASTTARTASAPTASTPTASARACSPKISSRSAPRRAACPRRTT